MLEMGRESAVQAPTSSLPHHSDSQRREMLSRTLRQLPPELLCVIMSYLPLEDIMSLKRSCKPLSRMVCEPGLRSYHSRMREAGLRDRPPPDGLSIRKRLMALDRWESAWDDAHKSIVADPTTQKQQRQVVEIADGDPDSRMLVVEGFYVEMDPLADGRADSCGYKYLDLGLSSPSPEDVRSAQYEFGQQVGILCYAFAIKYDLFAVLIEAPWLSDQAVLYLLNFYDGQPHPFVRRNQPICITDKGFCVSNMRVIDDQLLIVMTVDYPGRPESWMALVGLNDQSVTTIDAPSTHFLNDIIVLSHGIIALVNSIDNTLELYRLDTTTAILHKLRTLELPPIDNDLVLFRISTAHGAFTDPSQGNAPSSCTRPSCSSPSPSPAALFYGDPERAITCIVLHYMAKRKNWNNDAWFHPEEHARFFLVARRSALCALAGDDAAQAQDASGHTPWCTWGPAVEARVLRSIGFGAHATLHERLFVFWGGALTHYDFNPHRARGALNGGDDTRENRGASSGDRDRGGGGGGGFTVVEDAHPYRSTRITLPGDLDVYFDTDRIVRVVKFDQGESPEVNGDGALVCRRVIIHPMTG